MSMKRIIRTKIPERYSNVHGRDLHCPVCGAGAADVTPDYPLDPDPHYHVLEHTILWHCTNGHDNASTFTRRAE